MRRPGGAFAPCPLDVMVLTDTLGGSFLFDLLVFGGHRSIMVCVAFGHITFRRIL